MVTALLKLLELSLLFGACSLGPGFLIVRRLPWTAAEKIAASFGLSVLLMGAASFLVYYGNLPVTSYGALTVFGTVAFAAGWNDLKVLWRDPETRAVATAYGLVALWMFGLLGLIRSFGGGGWAGDWVEQYDRVRFFLHHQPLHTDLRGVQLPARPPLLNLFCVPFFEMTGAGLPQYQTLCVLLSVSTVFPAYLFARSLSGQRAMPLVVLVAVLAFNPMLVQNSTYPWTKMLAASYVALGLYFYVAGWKAADGWRLRAAVCALAAGVLTHYSAAPYAVCVALHFVFVGSAAFAKREEELLYTGGLAVAVIGPWIAWSVSAYGSALTFGGNTTVTGFQSQTFRQNASMVAGNVFDTIVPHFLRGVDFSQYAEAGQWGHVRELAFLTYQANAFFMLGSAGWIALGFVLMQSRPHWDRSLAIFWALVCGTAFVVGVGAHPWSDSFGLAHISLQPLAVAGLGVLAGTWESWTRVIRKVVLGGLAIDLLFGVVLHVLFESRTFGEGPAADKGLIAGALRALPDAANSNWIDKTSRHFMFVGDAVDPVKWLIVIGLALGASAILRQLGSMIEALPPASEEALSAAPAPATGSESL